ncbi:MAG: 16S rRNA (cytidine(1402)-2'-O)-methyltransferase [Candidatus Thiodiazotropha sp.]
MSKGILYVVATPIGNLDDLSPRAVSTLRQVDWIAAEDTRHTKPLLRHYGIDTPLRAVHQYNEQAQLQPLLEALRGGQSIALVSDAGTPLISDPGFPLVQAYAAEGGQVVPIPGVSAIICALSAAGLPTDRFLFAGFPPRTQSQRQRWFEALSDEPSTLVFYEASHRIEECLRDMQRVFGDARNAVIGRELTKRHETFLRGRLPELIDQVCGDPDQRKGEFVVLVGGAPEVESDQVSLSVELILQVLLDELPLKQAVSLAAKITGRKKNALYEWALNLSKDRDVK